MNLEDYHALFIVVTLGLALVVASPAVGVVLPKDGSEEFSEFWLLGSDHMAEGYPFNVGEGEEYSVFIGVGNHMGGSEYYMVSVKFRNSTQSLPDINGSVASSLSVLYEYRFLIGDDEVWEVPVSFGVGKVGIEDQALFVGYVLVDGVSFPVDVCSVWDSERAGYFFQLFIELWRYDVLSESFRFDNRYVGIWLNITASL